MPVRGIRKTCGARCRTKVGQPCLSPAMKNGRCRMHGGVFSKLEKHGRATLKAKEERRGERTLLNEIRKMNEEIEKAY